jgi:hypothetical protein
MSETAKPAVLVKLPPVVIGNTTGTPIKPHARLDYRQTGVIFFRIAL